MVPRTRAGQFLVLFEGACVFTAMLALPVLAVAAILWVFNVEPAAAMAGKTGAAMLIGGAAFFVFAWFVELCVEA